MDNNETKEVKEFVDKVTVDPSEDTELVNKEGNEAESDSSQTKTEDDTEETGDTEEEDTKEEETENIEDSEIRSIEGETPKERALRLEVTRMKREVSKYKKDELFTPIPKPQQVNKVLEDYDVDQVKELKSILSAAADELGFVKKDELYKTLTEDRRDDIWNSFLDKHPEYLLENDPEGVFYNQLKEEFSIFKEPTTAKGFQQLLNRAHESIFGIKSTPININKINAQQEKIKVASHSGGTVGSKSKSSKPIDTSNLRLDALKGFTQDEINELFTK